MCHLYFPVPQQSELRRGVRPHQSGKELRHGFAPLSQDLTILSGASYFDARLLVSTTMIAEMPCGYPFMSGAPPEEHKN